MRVHPTERTKVVKSLTRILGPLRASSGCIACHLYTDLEDEQAILFAEEWADEASLAASLQAESTRVLLSALDCASAPPELRMDTLVNTRGIEFVAACRNGVVPA
jgi:quinol monooxygenase YgiN